MVATFDMAVVLVNDTLLKTCPDPPWRVGPTPPVKLIWDVPALKVRFVDVKKESAVPVLDKAMVLAPRLMVRVLVLDDDRKPAVTANPAVVKVPCVTFRVRVLMLSASPSVSVMPAPFTVTPLNVLPAVVSVPVPAKVIMPVWE